MKKFYFSSQPLPSPFSAKSSLDDSWVWAKNILGTFIYKRTSTILELTPLLNLKKVSRVQYKFKLESHMQFKASNLLFAQSQALGKDQKWLIKEVWSDFFSSSISSLLFWLLPGMVTRRKVIRTLYITMPLFWFPMGTLPMPPGAEVLQCWLYYGLQEWFPWGPFPSSLTRWGTLWLTSLTFYSTPIPGGTPVVSYPVPIVWQGTIRRSNPVLSAIHRENSLILRVKCGMKATQILPSLILLPL